MDNISQVIVGKNETVKLVLTALIADGHLLLEDVPGTGKTLLAKSLAASIGGVYKRVQFTPDLLPSDITGFNYFIQNENRFRFQEGPVMANVLLADEINRTVPRTQSSLLESMEERQVTIDSKTYPLPQPFFTIATQNPVELEGTFPLPEAQLDRFLMKIHLGFPDEKDEMNILRRFQLGNPLQNLEAVASPEIILSLQQAVKSIKISEPVLEYVTRIVQKTRTHDVVEYGASPRGSMALMRSGQAFAALEGRAYVLPDDVKRLVCPVLAHRLILKENDRLRGQTPENVLEQIIQTTAVPDGTTI